MSGKDKIPSEHLLGADLSGRQPKKKSKVSKTFRTGSIFIEKTALNDFHLMITARKSTL